MLLEVKKFHNSANFYQSFGLETQVFRFGYLTDPQEPLILPLARIVSSLPQCSNDCIFYCSYKEEDFQRKGLMYGLGSHIGIRALKIFRCVDVEKGPAVWIELLPDFRGNALDVCPFLQGMDAQLRFP